MSKLRPDAVYDIQPMLRDALSKMPYIYQGCINCDKFDQTAELCKLANARPPVKVILYGCPKWEFDGIPF